MPGLPEAADQAKFIVFLSAGLETGQGTAAADLGEKAREQQIPIYVISLNSEHAQPLQKLAQDGGACLPSLRDSPVSTLCIRKWLPIANSLI